MSQCHKMSQGMNIIAKKLPVHPMVILFLREFLQTPQVNKGKYFTEKRLQQIQSVVFFQLLPHIIHAKQNPFPKGQLGLLALRCDQIHKKSSQRSIFTIAKVGDRWHELDSSLLCPSKPSPGRCYCNGCHQGW